jgi:hypothetical protein
MLNTVTAWRLASIGDANAHLRSRLTRESAMLKRRHFKQFLKLEERLEQEAANLRRQAANMPPRSS